LALCVLAAPLILLWPALVRADAIITFDVSGFATNISLGTLDSCPEHELCAFSGTFRVDTTKGTVESGGFDISLPGLPAFDRLVSSVKFFPLSKRMLLGKTAPPANCALLSAHFQSQVRWWASMGGQSQFLPGGDTFGNYLFESGSITPVPEPSSLILFASGLLVLGLRRKFGKKVGHPLSA